ncbi:MAG: XrtA-associated tyrosine autokinase [Comamonadaceae bacterium]|nr:tyrosine-protein kinase family protein [Pseudomonadota bacterium]MBS0610651.1 tyrosine-protein kinase family protein [Pseudomonadota bacterium]MDE2414956.1 XrtA-associated tyrosine autokinase [Comamonadaceae bacterium]
MTSSIEKAAQRLEQLRKSGTPLPGDRPHQDESAPPLETMDAAHARPESKTVHIDLTALGAGGYVTPNVRRSATTEQYRVIKRPLLDNATGKGASLVANGNLIMVTSALPGEGKSFTAINLAMSLAMELDHTVMLVDADVTHPSVMTKLGLPPAPGLLDVLREDGVGLADVLLRTNVEKLTLLPAGLAHQRATELLASDAMTTLVRDMGKRYGDRIIIFDSPPLLLTTEARVLASHMGQVVVVVQAEKTLQSEVNYALSTIESSPVKYMVLNRVRNHGLGSYGYGYDYGQMIGKSRSVGAAV